MKITHSPRPLVMGILNVTPDSFSDGGLYFDPSKAISRAAQMIAEGADIIDVGGESTRPGAKPVPPDQQIRRTAPVIAAIRERHPNIHISIDTQLSEVAQEAIQAGATIVNDISALRTDLNMASFVGTSGAYAVLMHMQGTPQTMQQNPQYDNVVEEVTSFLLERRDGAIRQGIDRGKIILDPGFGFGKTVEQNLQLLAGLKTLVDRAHPTPILVGASRKSFIGKILGIDDPAEHLTGTIVTHTIALLAGARILRVHDIKEARPIIGICQSLKNDTVTS